MIGPNGRNCPRIAGIAAILALIAVGLSVNQFPNINSRFLMTTSVYSVAGLCALWAATDSRAAPRYRLDEHHAIDLT